MRILVLLPLFLVASAALADNSHTADRQVAAQKTLSVSPDRFRCEKINDATVASLKDKLVLNCDLNLPFSIAATDNISTRSYTYCCQLHAGAVGGAE